MVGGVSKYQPPSLPGEEKHGYNALKQSLKRLNLDQNINDSKTRIWNTFFGKYFFSFGLFLWFSSRKRQSQQQLVKKITHLTIQFCSKNLAHFKNLNSLDFENNMLSQRCQKPLSFYKFSSQHFSVWCQKKYMDCIIS